MSSFQYVTCDPPPVRHWRRSSCTLLGRGHGCLGWRIPFVIGAGLAIVAYWMRRRLQESQSFVRAELREACAEACANSFSSTHAKP